MDISVERYFQIKYNSRRKAIRKRVSLDSDLSKMSVMWCVEFVNKQQRLPWSL